MSKIVIMKENTYSGDMSELFSGTAEEALAFAKGIKDESVASEMQDFIKEPNCYFEQILDDDNGYLTSMWAGNDKDKYIVAAYEND